jgi:hypothetical protein
MDTQEVLERALARLTPTWLRETIVRLAKEQPSRLESGVSLPDILDALLQGADLGVGAQAWSAKLRLRQAVSEATAQAPGLRFVEGDA